MSREVVQRSRVGQDRVGCHLFAVKMLLQEQRSVSKVTQRAHRLRTHLETDSARPSRRQQQVLAHIVEGHFFWAKHAVRILSVGVG